MTDYLDLKVADAHLMLQPVPLTDEARRAIHAVLEQVNTARHEAERFHTMAEEQLAHSRTMRAEAERHRDEWRALAEPLIAYGQEHARDLGIPLGASIVEHLLAQARACAEAERERDEAEATINRWGRDIDAAQEAMEQAGLRPHKHTLASAIEGLRRERDEAKRQAAYADELREQYDREVLETTKRAERAERERDATGADVLTWRARALEAERERDDALACIERWCREAQSRATHFERKPDDA